MDWAEKPAEGSGSAFATGNCLGAGEVEKEWLSDKELEQTLLEIIAEESGACLGGSFGSGRPWTLSRSPSALSPSFFWGGVPLY